MAITFSTIGTEASTATTTLSLPYPASISSGNLLLAGVTNKYPNNSPATPTGWTLVSGAQGSGGIGGDAGSAGHVYVTVFARVADGTESGSLSVSIPSNLAAIGRILQYTKTSTGPWGITATNGSFNVSNSQNWSITTATNPGMTIGDKVIAFSGSNQGVYNWSAEACVCTGVTFGTVTEREEGNFDSGNDACSLEIDEFSVVAGDSTSTLTYTMFSDNSGTNRPAGATVVIALRELVAATYAGVFKL